MEHFKQENVECPFRIKKWFFVPACFLNIFWVCLFFSCAEPLEKVKSKIKSGSTQTQQYSKSDSLFKLSKLYTQAVGDYIRLVNQKYHLRFDTLFFGKHVYQQADDFPDIDLPPVIEKTYIQIISPQAGLLKQQHDTNSYYINLFGEPHKQGALFTFFTFSKGMAHQFDCFIEYDLDTIQHKFKMKDHRFENFFYRNH
ncbi:MAG TPA: hypothetical protein PLP34_02705 [Chitinophagaceae bacterium]|nr:hypothetical protein [Chitinophagaceae bacterium]HNF71294.1 hypothetical protein [Chitinophagaceae bacterium]